MAADDGTLGAPVGVGQPNNLADVKRVQHLLNERQVPSEERLAEDGAFGPRTTMRLIGYQRDTVGMSRPDSIVAPGGPTMRSLAGAPSSDHAASAERDTAIDRLVASRPFRHGPTHTQDWIDRVLPAAQAVHEKWGIPASVTIAQGALESGWGARHPENEYFGVKGHAPDGSSTKLTTHEVTHGHRHPERDGFRAYGSLEEAADDYGRFLNTQPRFKAALEHKDDPHRFVQEVGKAHYATDPDYVAKISGIIDHHGLTRYDAAPVQVAGSPTPGRRPFDAPQSPAAGAGGAEPLDARAHWLAIARRGRETAITGLGAAPAQEAAATRAATPTSRQRQ